MSSLSINVRPHATHYFTLRGVRPPGYRILKETAKYSGKHEERRIHIPQPQEERSSHSRTMTADTPPCHSSNLRKRPSPKHGAGNRRLSLSPLREESANLCVTSARMISPHRGFIVHTRQEICIWTRSPMSDVSIF